MDITLESIIFASCTIPTDFGLIAAAIAGAGSLLFIALDLFLMEVIRTSFLFERTFSLFVKIIKK